MYERFNRQIAEEMIIIVKNKVYNVQLSDGK